MINDLIKKSRVALKIIESYSQDEVDKLCEAVAWSGVKEENCAKISKLAVEESKMGYYEGKYGKNASKNKRCLQPNERRKIC